MTSHDVNKGVDNISDQYGNKKNGLKLRLKCAGITVLNRIKLRNVLANAMQSFISGLPKLLPPHELN